MPNLAVLNDILEAFRWLEENYGSAEAEPTGTWMMSVFNHKTNEAIEAFGDGFLNTFARLQGKLEGTIPMDDSDLLIMEAMD